MLQLSYAIGVARPLSIYADTYGADRVDEAKLETALMEIMNLSPRGIREHLKLNKPDLCAHLGLWSFRPSPGSGRRLLLGKDRSRRRTERPRLTGADDGGDEASDAAERRTLYGRCQGKRLSAHQARLVAELLPRLAVDRGRSRRADERYSRSRPREIRLEIGFGGGEHLVGARAETPDVGFIGCEPFLNGVAKLLAAIDAEGLDNIRVRMGDARALVEALSPPRCRAIYLLYPDPWPKRRQTNAASSAPRPIARFARGSMRPAANCASPPTSTITPAGRYGASSPRRISAGARAAPTTGASLGRAGRRRATRPRRAPPGALPPI